MKVVAVGPYIGDFQTEITSFRPYVIWIYCNLKYDRFYVSTYSDRRFLYHWVPDYNFIPVFNVNNRPEVQCCYFNGDVNHNSYLKLVRKFRNNIFNRSTDVEKEDIKLYTPAYTKLADPIHFNKKKFSSIIVDYEKGDFVLYEDEVYFDKYNYKRISDFSTWEERVSALCSAKVVVCEAGVWTIIANMQKIPVFSWSEGAIGKYKQDGDFNFKNENMVIYADNKNTLLRGMENYLKRIMETDNADL
jgi:hypothetical protein